MATVPPNMSKIGVPRNLNVPHHIGTIKASDRGDPVVTGVEWLAFRFCSFYSDTMRKASLADVEQLVTMMAEFYAGSPYTLNLRRATEAFRSLLADERLGHIWFIQAHSKDVGYVVVTLCYSMNYGGLSAVVDDFFIQRPFRGAGLGKAAMAEVRSFCACQGVRAIHVETGRDNGPALAVYRHAGFVPTDHAHLTLGLAEPTHAP
jgi:GNAT superfamily N-acetyltransferase